MGATPDATSDDVESALGPLARLDHVGIAVADLDAGLRFYQRVLGLRLAHVETNREQGVREAMLSPDGVTGPFVQLLAPLDADSPIAHFIDRSGPGLQQVAFAVDDVDAAASTLRSRGLRVLYESGRAGTHGSRINFVHPKDAGGVLIELVEAGAAQPD